jgi:hypothetical protein
MALEAVEEDPIVVVVGERVGLGLGLSQVSQKCYVSDQSNIPVENQ